MTENNAKPGKYTVKVTDDSGKYALMSGDFTLTTDDIPVKYSDGKLVKADGFSDEDAANFIKNIASVEVNGTAYNAAGKRSVKLVGEDGTINFEVKSGENNVFDGSGNYSITVTATGYTKPYSFEIKPEPETTTITATTTTTASGNSDSPKTGDTGAGVSAAIFALAAMSAFALRKKKT